MREWEVGLRSKLENEWFYATEEALAEGKEVPAANKPPWAQTLEEFKQSGNDIEEHWISVKAAFIEGKPVPPEVLLSYPDLETVVKG